MSSKKTWLGVVGIILLTAILASFLLHKSDSKEHKHDEHGEHEPAHKSDSEEHQHDEQEHEHQSEAMPEQTSANTATLRFSQKQLADYGIQLVKASHGELIQQASYPAKLVANTDQQAHVSASFLGRVESVSVSLGQKVKKGQALATLFVPDLVEQQANLSITQQTLQLATQDYEREKQLFEQGISARQDYQRAYNSYRQAQIMVQAAQIRLSALDAKADSQGRYVITAPLDGIISRKDIVVGEQVQQGQALFSIDQLDKLWLEFVLPTHTPIHVLPQQKITFQSVQTKQVFEAIIHNLTTEADSQTGRLQARAQVINPTLELRPNLMVNVLLQGQALAQVLRIQKSAIQQIDGKTVVFVAEPQSAETQFKPTVIQTGAYSSDGQWLEVKSGLEANQQYVTKGSFLLKSELEKGEAEHDH